MIRVGLAVISLLLLVVLTSCINAADDCGTFDDFTTSLTVQERAPFTLAMQRCVTSSKKECFKHESDNSKEMHSEDNHLYKIFYGEWEIVDYIVLTKQTANFMNVIGDRFAYDQGGFYYDGYHYDAKYTYNIVPVFSEKQRHVVPNIDIQDLGLNGEYFVYVVALYFSEEHGNWRAIDEPGSSFYIKDDDTLIVDVFGGAFSAKRLKHIDNHELYYLPFY